MNVRRLEEPHLNCPRDGMTLAVVDNRGIEVDRCGQCKGLWLDYEELGMLEDKVFDLGDLKGSTVYSPGRWSAPAPAVVRP